MTVDIKARLKTVRKIHFVFDDNVARCRVSNKNQCIVQTPGFRRTELAGGKCRHRNLRPAGLFAYFEIFGKEAPLTGLETKALAGIAPSRHVFGL